jgi:hypothetical protein
VGQGSTTLTPSQPAGFTTPAQFGSVSATVTIASLNITDQVAVGQNLQAPLGVFIGSGAPAGGLPITLTSSNSAALRLSASATAAGSASITVTIPAGQTSVPFFLQALGNSGSASYTASAPGYPTRTLTVPLTPSGVVLIGPLGAGFPFLSASLSGGSTAPIFVTMAQLDPSTNAYVTTQQLAGGKTLSITLNNQSSAIGTVVSPVSITGGNDTVVSPFTPFSLGQTIITVNQPAGFSTPSNLTGITAVVIP